MITSGSNNRIKEAMLLQQKAKLRRDKKLFVAEGIRFVSETPAELLQEVFLSESYAVHCGYLRTELSGLELDDTAKEKLSLPAGSYHAELVSDGVFGKLSDTRTPQGVLAVIRMPEYSFDELCGQVDETNTTAETEAERTASKETAIKETASKAPLYLLLEELQDPGNIGTILRTAEGAGVDAIFLTRGCADLFNPKVIRSTMGSIYRVPFVWVDNVLETIAALQKRGIAVYAAHLQQSKDYDEYDYRKGTAFLIGNEGNGLRRETADAADAYLRIPMSGRLESLNAAVASALLVYEAARQRRR